MPTIDVIQNSNGNSSDAEAKKVGVNKPSDSLLKQQKLKAWQPILTAGTVLPMFFIIGFIFIPVGAALLVAANNVFEYSYDYTDCEDVTSSNKTMCKDVLSHNSGAQCRCQHTFSISHDVSDQVFVYYGLSNFYQNHRRYVKSRDDRQLLGLDVKSVAQECAPFNYVDERGTKVPIVPCGATANSMFNDTFYMSLQTMATSSSFSAPQPIGVPFNFTEIAWATDVSLKFRNPANLADFDNTAKPINWQYKITDLTNKMQNESFIVWMRISALPTFRKLYARIDSTNIFSGGLKAGNYTVNIIYSYAVDMFDGRKRFILSTTSWIGGKNPFLGIAYIIVGCLCVLTGTVFFFIHLKYGKSLTEMANVHR